MVGTVFRDGLKWPAIGPGYIEPFPFPFLVLWALHHWVGNEVHVIIVVILLDLKVDLLLVALLGPPITFALNLHISDGIIDGGSHLFALIFIVLVDDFFVAISIFSFDSFGDCQPFTIFEEDELEKMQKCQEEDGEFDEVEELLREIGV